MRQRKILKKKKLGFSLEFDSKYMTTEKQNLAEENKAEEEKEKTQMQLWQKRRF